MVKIGDIFLTDSCGECIVIDYKNCRKVTVRFNDTGATRMTRSDHLKNGKVKDWCCPNICGVGFIGDGPYKSEGTDGKNARSYSCWKSMIYRCYNQEVQHYPRYGGRGVVVCEEWHNYQNYAKWYKDNDKGSSFCVDKDLRVPGSMKYSPDTCEFIPENINNLLVASNKARGEYPLGVSFYEPTNKFKARCSDGSGNYVDLGYHLTPEKAFAVYREFKESLIKSIAEDQKVLGNISMDVYTSLINWIIVEYPE